MAIPTTNVKMTDISSNVDGETSLLKSVEEYFLSPNVVPSGLSSFYCTGATAYDRLNNLRTKPYRIGKFRGYNPTAYQYHWRSGLFYTWQAAATVHVPDGWHVATQSDWYQIFSTVDSNFQYGYSEAAFGFKSGLNYTQNPFSGWTNHIGDNGSGFNLHAVGHRWALIGSYNNWANVGESSRIWSVDNNFGEPGYFKYHIQMSGNSLTIHQGRSSWGIPEGGLGYAYDMLNIRLVKDDDVNTGSVMDIQGNIYPTVKIGNKVVTAENIRTSVNTSGNAFTDLRGGPIYSGAFVDSIAMDYDRP